MAWARLDGSDARENAARGAGTVGRAEIVVGSQRAGAFLPLVGRLWEK
jgi:hypothetical protein